MRHYSDERGWKAIRSQVNWLFKTFDPPPRHLRSGAYFTTLPPSTPKLARRLGLPRRKVEFVFEFRDAGDLTAIPGGRGRFIFFSPLDYPVVSERQVYEGRT